jgi:formylglycine-generating enzyme required for sulfatase activity
MPDGTKTYVFAHLTLQEHCAGRHITLGVDNPLALVLRHRTDDRWREPILLGMGLTRPSDLHSILADLIDREENDQLKPIERWYRDLILAAEIGADRDWDYLRTRPMVKVDRLQRDLRRGLVELLGDKAQPLPVAERVRAGFLLGDIGDPRFPVTLDAWREEVARRNELFGQPESYWCYVRPGTYCIGGWQKNEVITDLALPGFWIARFPITVAQFAPFVQAGYALDVHRWWTLHGRRWKRQRIRTQPWLWDDSAYTCPNQPVIGVTWYEAMAFCAWLNDQLAGALSPGHVVRLPTEAEWETAAAYDSVGNRHPYPWGALASTPELVISVESKLGRPAPIGSCPAGVAACGALDMVGNMWEWVASRYRAYPADSGRHVDDFTMDDRNVPLRGGSYDSNSISVRCGLRGWNSPDEYDPYNGFRIVIAPHLH